MRDPKVSNRIRRLRFDHNEMTQEKLAELTGVTRQTIVALEGKKYIPLAGAGVQACTCVRIDG